MNDTLVVKQSASAFCGIFGGMGLVGLGAWPGCCLAARLALPGSAQFFALLALVLSAGLWYVVNTWGGKAFLRAVRRKAVMVFRTPEKQDRTVWFW